MSDKQTVRSCNGCVYYYVTWEPKTPKGCKFFGFKSAQMPCTVVRKSTGQPCNMYTPKGGTAQENNSKKNIGNNIDRTI